MCLSIYLFTKKSKSLTHIYANRLKYAATLNEHYIYSQGM